jgi:putative copper resistance protein D
LAWIGLAAAMFSGGIWLLLQASAMSGQAFRETLVSGVMLTVLNETEFGLVSEIRLALALVLAACLFYDHLLLPRWIALGAALCLIAAIAWTGHAASTLDELGFLHLTADALHLCAAAAWVGGLVSLALLLRVVRCHRASVGVALELDVLRRFSALGMASVAALVISGAVNSWILVGSWRALATTEYGWILVLKIAAFGVIVGFAAVNRFWLTPRLAMPAEGDVFCWLLRNISAEIALGLFIFAVVGVLGTLHPAAHLLK